MRSLTIILGLAATALAMPVVEERTGAQIVHLVFHGGPAQYQMTFPADGSSYPTKDNMAVSIIDAPDFNAIYQCTFNTVGQKTLVGSITPQGLAQIFVGPPQPITSVSCHGTCVGTYGDCYRDGQFVGQCCNGYCAANKCRPYVPF
ncbi:hypothetical protein B0H63DRAFT_523278 [Podospora didyma]|uniref:SSCRP protein n=1 Tax=Podospora didyma TaxID=330526 RepID=A0AAE0U008_9PEZI|nr:hypothetical protein B0H63DRAFT_523278 [Podospora didyma]